MKNSLKKSPTLSKKRKSIFGTSWLQLNKRKSKKELKNWIKEKEFLTMNSWKRSL